jgi:hypothetical protein
MTQTLYAHMNKRKKREKNTASLLIFNKFDSKMEGSESLSLEMNLCFVHNYHLQTKSNKN